MSSGVVSSGDGPRQDLPPAAEAAAGRFTRFETALMLAVAVFALLLVGSWLGNGHYPRLFEDKRETTFVILFETNNRVRTYGMVTGRLPVNLAAVHQASIPWNSDELGSNLYQDGWGRPLEYAIGLGDTYTLCSLGRDGKEGGVGEDADIAAPTCMLGYRPHVSFASFVVARTSRMYVLACGFAAMIAGIVWVNGPQRVSMVIAFQMTLIILLVLVLVMMVLNTAS